MATHHASETEVVDLDSWADDLPDEKSKAIAKIDDLELARLVIGAGEQMHRSGYCQVDGSVVVHCVKGEVEVQTPDVNRLLKGGQLLYLKGKTDHALKGVADSVVLLSIVLHRSNDSTIQASTA